MDHLSIPGTNRYCCFIAIAQIALSLEKIFTEAWDKAATPAKNKQNFVQLAYPFNPSIIADETSAPSLVTQNEDAQVSKTVTVFETTATAPMSQKKTRNSSPVPGVSSRVCAKYKQF